MPMKFIRQLTLLLLWIIGRGGKYVTVGFGDPLKTLWVVSEMIFPAATKTWSTPSTQTKSNCNQGTTPRNVKNS